MSQNSNLLRTVIGILLGVLFIFAGLKLKDRIVASKKQPQISVNKDIKKVFTTNIKNKDIPITIQEKGNLNAIRSVELYSEVQGLFKSGSKLFKEGQSYRKNELVLSIDDAEFVSNLKAQRSVLYNQLAQLTADLRLDYPDVADKWIDYLSSLDFDKSIPALPDFESEREKFFINSKGIVTSYYNIKNLEERHKKYRLYAPFNGAITEALVYPGTLIRTGQKLGTIVNDSVFELVASVDESYKEYIKIGNKVKVTSLDKSQEWTGKIGRIDPQVNTITQGINVYIEISGKALKPGMFLEVELDAGQIQNSFEISRKLLTEDNKLFIVEADSLRLIPIQIEFKKEKTAVVSGIPDGTQILSNPIPGSYEGMRVENIKS